jgi:hypothetical protein
MAFLHWRRVKLQFTIKYLQSYITELHPGLYEFLGADFVRGWCAGILERMQIYPTKSACIVEVVALAVQPSIEELTLTHPPNKTNPAS